MIGEPGKSDNGIITLPHLKKIQTKDIDGNLVYIDYSTCEEKRRHICRINKDKVLLPGDSLICKLPNYLENKTLVAMSPVKENEANWIKPGLIAVNEGYI